MTPGFDTVAIIGVGLLGGSLGLALKTRGMARHIRGVGRRQSSLDEALQLGAIDETFLNVRQAVSGAELVILCPPAALVPALLDEIRDYCSPDTIVTDVASTKTTICQHARATWPHPLHFIGSHPMAGSEKSGPTHATPTLYEGCVTMVELDQHLDSMAQSRVEALWRGLGANVIYMTPEEHDQIVARTSHIPHVTAACLAILANRIPHASPMAGPGFRDVTRIAASRPEIWRDICLTNRTALLQGLEELTQDLLRITDQIRTEDASGIEAFFEAGRTARREVIGE